MFDPPFQPTPVFEPEREYRKENNPFEYSLIIYLFKQVYTKGENRTIFIILSYTLLTGKKWTEIPLEISCRNNKL